MKILQICPPHLTDVATLPWEIQKVTFNSIKLYIHLIIYVISKMKIQNVIRNCENIQNETTLV